MHSAAKLSGAEPLVGWCKNTLRRASVPHEMMAAVVGGIARYARHTCRTLRRKW